MKKGKQNKTAIAPLHNMQCTYAHVSCPLFCVSKCAQRNGLPQKSRHGRRVLVKGGKHVYHPFVRALTPDMRSRRHVCKCTSRCTTVLCYFFWCCLWWYVMNCINFVASYFTYNCLKLQ